MFASLVSALVLAVVTIPSPQEVCGVTTWPAPGVHEGKVVLVPRESMKAGPGVKRVVIPPKH